MDNASQFSVLIKNQDLFRGSVLSMDKQAIARALLWLRGDAPFPYPTSIHLNLTLRCTARCIHCKQWTWPNHSEFTVSELQQLFETFKSWGVQTITFGGGNPLLYEHISLALQVAREANIQVGIISEGIRMTDELVDTICRHACWIRFSLDGPTADVHDNIRNTPGLFDLVTSCVKSLQSRESRPHIGLNCVVQKRNLNGLSHMIDLARFLKVDTLLFKVPHGEDQGNRFLLSILEWEHFVIWARSMATKELGVKTNLHELCDLFDLVFRGDDAVQGKPVRSFYVQNQVRCFAPLFFLTCDSQGNIYPCDYLQGDTRLWGGKYGDMRNEFCLGNVLQDSQQVLERLATLLRERIHGLPASGYSECGSCTRFCQLNASLTRMDQHLKTSGIDEQIITEYFSLSEAKKPGSYFL